LKDQDDWFNKKGAMTHSVNDLMLITVFDTSLIKSSTPCLFTSIRYRRTILSSMFYLWLSIL